MSVVKLASEETLGRYQIVAKLGRGGMAEVFLGRLVGAGGFEKMFAIKRMLPAYSDDPAFVAMFQNEGRIASGLSHPNVCQVYELGEEKGQLFLVMELLRGLAWNDVVTALPDSDPTTAARFVAGVLLQAAEGLHHAHSATDVDGRPLAIVHRDVSPSNLFITTDGIVKLLDFGVSKLVHHGSATRTGALKGKLPYMAPEQIRGETVDARSDLFSLGVVAWEALAGRSLFDRPSDYQIWKAVAEDPIPPLPKQAAYTALEPVILRALSRDIAARQASVRVFSEELRRAMSSVGEPMFGSEIRDSMNAWLAPNLERMSRDLADVVSKLRGVAPPASSGTPGDETRLFTPTPPSDGARLRGVAVKVDKALARPATDEEPTSFVGLAEGTITDPDSEETYELERTRRAAVADTAPRALPARAETGDLTTAPRPLPTPSSPPPIANKITLPMPLPIARTPAPGALANTPIPGMRSTPTHPPPLGESTNVTATPERSASTMIIIVAVVAVLAGIVGALILS